MLPKGQRRAADFIAAEKTALSIVDTDQQARALTDLAKATLEPAVRSYFNSSAQGTTTARRLLALALSVGTWTIPLDVVYRVDPNAVVDLADFVLDHGGRT